MIYLFLVTVKSIDSFRVRYTKKGKVRLVTNISTLNIKKNNVTFYTFKTYLMSFYRFALRDKVILRLVKLHSYIVYVVECTTTLDIRK